MAQNVESKIKINVQVDTKEAQKNIEELKKETESLDDFVEKTWSKNKKYTGSNDVIGDAVDDWVKRLEQGSLDLNKLADNKQFDIKSFSGVFNDLLKNGKISTSTFTSLGKALGGVGAKLTVAGAAAYAAKKGFKIINDNAKDLNDTLIKLSKAFSEGAVDGIGWFIDSLNDLNEVIKQSYDVLKEYSELGLEVQNSYKGLANSIGGDTVNLLSEYADTLEQVVGLDATGIIADINKMAGALQHLGGTDEQLAGASSALYEMALNLHGANPALVSTEKAIEEINKALLSGKINKKGASSLLMLLGSDGVEKFNKLNNEVERYNFLIEKSSSIKGAYLSYLNTEAGRIEILNQQYQSFQGNLGQIALKLYAQVAPVLTHILQLANSVLNNIMSIFNIDVKDTSGISAIADSFDEITNSASKANKQVASFDDVIQINDSKSSTDALGSIAELGSYNSMLGGLTDDVNDLTDAWKAFTDAVADGDYQKAGAEFIKIISDGLGGIDWDYIKEKASELGDSFADFINSMTNMSDAEIEQAWKNIGNTISQSINTITELVGGFIGRLNFKNLGEALGVSWKEMWENLDTKDAADLLYDAFIGVFQFVLGWLDGGGLNKAAQQLSEVIKNFFSRFKTLDGVLEQDDIVNAITGVIDDVIEALHTIVNTLTSDEVKDVVLGLVRKLVTSFKDNAGEWGSKLNEIFNDIVDFIISIIDTADDAGLMDAISRFLDGLDLAELLAKWMQLKFKIWWEKTKINLSVKLREIGGFLWDGVKNIIGFVLGLAGTLFFGLLAIQNDILGLIQKGVNWIFSSIASLWDSITSLLSNGIDWLLNKLSELFSALNPANWSKRIGEAFAGIAAPAGTWFSGFEFKVPFMATGGIVTGSTIANIGEAGAEAVLPLESNTGWMDKLAEKLASKMNKGEGTNGGSVTLDMSGYNKNFYTRAEMYEFGAMVVEALRVYGVNISLAV